MAIDLSRIGKTNLLLEWLPEQTKGLARPAQRVIMELKVVHKSPRKTLDEGLAQTAASCARDRDASAHLILFDRRRPEGPWEEKVLRREEPFEGQRIVFWGM